MKSSVLKDVLIVGLMMVLVILLAKLLIVSMIALIVFQQKNVLLDVTKINQVTESVKMPAMFQNANLIIKIVLSVTKVVPFL